MEPTASAQFESAVYRKVSWRLIPLLVLAYTSAYLARTNVGLAKLQMLGDLHISSTLFGLGSGIFFAGYFFFEVPSNLLLHRIGARVSITRIMILWGIVSGCTMLVSSGLLFCVLRFVLGAAEAGFFPGIILYLTYWYPPERRAGTTALFMASIPLSGLIGGPLSGWIMHVLDGWHGLAGWRWMFAIEALPSIILGVVVFFVMKDRIEDAPWLGAQEKDLLRRRLLEQQRSDTCSSTAAALRNPYVWLMCAIYGFLATGVFGIGVWLPTMLKRAGAQSIVSIGWLTAIPNLFAVAAMILLARSSDRSRRRRWHLAGANLVAALALVGAVHSAGSLPLTVVLLTVATMGITAVMPLFWPLPTALLSGVGAAAGIAFVNSLGNLSVVLSQPIIGWLSDHSGHGTLYFLAANCVAGALATLAVPARLVDR